MIDYTLTIKRNNKAICTVGGSNMNYDNVIWWQLNKLVEIAKDEFSSKEELISKIENGTEYFHECESSSGESAILDLDNRTIEVPVISIYKPEDVTKKEACIDLKICGGEYYSVYGDGEEYKMEKVQFDDLDLLKKKTLSLDEFDKVSAFIDKLIIRGDSEFVLNDNFVIRLSYI